MAVEFLIGGLAASGACFFTNPLEVAKTRMQLQGELVARGQHAVHYRNVVHAFYTIGRVDGLLALQKGLVPALWYQFVMNGVRLGFYQRVVDRGLTMDKNGRVSLVRSVAAGAFSGCLGSAVASPLYMVSSCGAINYRRTAGIKFTHRPKIGIRTFCSSVFSLLGAKVPTENFCSRERKFPGIFAPRNESSGNFNTRE